LRVGEGGGDFRGGRGADEDDAVVADEQGRGKGWGTMKARVCAR